MPAQGGAGVACLVPSTPGRDQLGAIEALVNSAFYQWLLQGIGHPKSNAVQLMRHHYALLPWPFLAHDEVMALSEAGNAIRAVGGSEHGDAAQHWSTRTSLDDLAFKVLGVPEEVQYLIARELWREL